MGLVKSLLADQEAHGFSCREPFRVVGPECIADDGLKRFVASFAAEEPCGFCGSSSGSGVDLHDLFVYMATCVAEEYDDPSGEVACDREDGQYIGAQVFDAAELLWEIEDPFESDELRDVFIEARPHGRG